MEGSKRSYKLNLVPPSWLFDAVGKFRYFNLHLAHLVNNFQIKQKHMKIPAST